MSERAAPLDPLSRLALGAAMRLPRGAALVLNAWARVDRRLRDHPVPLRAWPERCIRLDLSSRVAPQYLIHGCDPYQVAEDALVARILRPGDVVYDVGANIGYTTLMFLKGVGPSGQVHAFEPSRRCCVHLRRNVEVGDPVVIVEKAVGREAGEVVLEEHAALNLSSVAGFGTPASRARRPAERYAVESIALDAYWRASGATPCFVKIDVEGCEAEVFEGMRELLATRAPILLFEAASKGELARNIAALRAADREGYRFARVAHDGTLVALEQSAGATNNYFAIPGWALARFDGIPLPAGRSD